MCSNLVPNWINEFWEVSKLPLCFPSIVILDDFISSEKYLYGRWPKVVSVKQENLMPEWVAQGISPLTFPCDLKCSFTSKARVFFGKNVIGHLFICEVLVNQLFLFVYLF